MKVYGFPVPGLTRDLSRPPIASLAGGGPGSGPWRWNGSRERPSAAGGGGGVKVYGFPVPGLTRDLWRPPIASLAGGGPGSGPGRGLLFLNCLSPHKANGAFRLHHGLAALRCDLHRPDGEPFCPGHGASGGSVRAYCEIQDPHTGLVRDARGFRRQLAKGTQPQALAARMEKHAYRRAQSELAGRHRAYSILISPRPGPDPGLLANCGANCKKRSRVKPGTAGTDVRLHSVLDVAGVVG